MFSSVVCLPRDLCVMIDAKFSAFVKEKLKRKVSQSTRELSSGLFDCFPWHYLCLSHYGAFQANPLLYFFLPPIISTCFGEYFI